MARGEAPGSRTWQLVEILNDAIYERGENVSTLSGVLDAAQRLDGIDMAGARKFLEGEEGVAEVRRRDRSAKERGVRSVPTFVIEGNSAEPVVFSGAQPAQAFLQAFKTVVT